MEKAPPPSPTLNEEEGKINLEDDLPPHLRYQQLISSLPTDEPKAWSFRYYKGFWFPEHTLGGVMSIQERFNSRPTDIVLISLPKSGTTWLKALTFAIVTRKRYYPFDDRHPLLSLNPHDCVPFMDTVFESGQQAKLEALPSPRILATHIPFSHLPKSMASSDCRIVYVCRDPKDTLVSLWHFMKEFNVLRPFQEVFGKFCKGICSYGPTWEHCLEYWRESIRRPEKVLFLKYEEMTADPAKNTTRLAEFIGQPFSPEEEREGVVEEIVKLCSFKTLSGVSKKWPGIQDGIVNNSAFFRKGGEGDWKNHFTAEMAEEMDKITQAKFSGSGLIFKNQ